MMASRDQPQEPTDPDVDLSVSAHRWELARGPFSAVAAVSVGGGLGAAARYGVSLLWPTPPGAFPWATLTINVLGCAMIGVLLVLVSDVWSAHRLVRPFFGTGVLGGFTTFSAYAVDVQHLVQVGRVGTGLSYLALTLLVALAAVWTAATTTRRLITSAFGRSCRSGRSW